MFLPDDVNTELCHLHEYDVRSYKLGEPDGWSPVRFCRIFASSKLKAITISSVIYYSEMRDMKARAQTHISYGLSRRGGALSAPTRRVGLTTPEPNGIKCTRLRRSSIRKERES